jgi:hypothetical protein
MNNIALNSIINKLYASTVRVIDSITLTPDDVSFDMLTDTLVISCNGTMTMNGYLWDVEELDKLPEVVRMVIRKFVIALRDGEVHGDHPELELISANKEFFLAREEAFVPAGVLCAAGIVDEHNMPTE